MATITKQEMRPYDAATPTVGYKEGASQTFKRGDLLQVDTAAGTNRVKIADADETEILGVAAEDAVGTADTAISVWVARAGERWIGNVTGDTLDRADLNTEVGIVKDSAGVWLVDLADTSATRVKIVALVDAHGDTNGRVLFVWRQSSLTYGE